MKRFPSLVAAATYASTLSVGWRFHYSEDIYTHKSLLGIAQAHDDENPADEESFYLVSPGGAIGFCEDEETIDWLFLSREREEALPSSLVNQEKGAGFCPSCGRSLTQKDRFCSSCGVPVV